MNKHYCLPVLKLGIVMLAVYLLSGCATVDRGYRGVVGVVDPDKMEMTTEVKWMTPPVNMGLRPVSPEKMTAHLRFRNTAGYPIDGLYENLLNKLQQAGYRLTDNPDEAHFSIVADVRYFGINKRSDGGASMLTGAVLGGLTGAAAGHAAGRGDSTLIGAGVGAAAGAATGKIMANRNKMTEVALAVDLRIGERVDGRVGTTRTGTTSARTTHGAAINIGGGVEGGSSSAGTTDRQQIEIEDEFLYHGNRVIATAEKMGLTPAEALPALQSRLSLGLSSVLP